MTNFRHHGRYFILSPVTVTVVGTTSLRWKVKPSNFMQPHETKVLVFNFVTPSNHIRVMIDDQFSASLAALALAQPASWMVQTTIVLVFNFVTPPLQYPGYDDQFSGGQRHHPLHNSNKTSTISMGAISFYLLSLSLSRAQPASGERWMVVQTTNVLRIQISAHYIRVVWFSM